MKKEVGNLIIFLGVCIVATNTINMAKRKVTKWNTFAYRSQSGNLSNIKKNPYNLMAGSIQKPDSFFKNGQKP